MNRNANPDGLQSMLKESVDQFLTEYRNGATNFSNFTSIFSRFLHNLPDPPLEIVWFYSALTFHSTKFTAQNSSNPVLIAKDLFQLLVSCSFSCNAVKKIAVLAPVIYELNSLVLEGEDWARETESLLEVIVSYISICCGSNFEQVDEFGALSCCFVDLVRVWTVEKNGESCVLGEDLRVFFPLVGNGICKGIVREGCGVGYLSGIVMAEAFLLRLCLKFVSATSRVELKKELRGWAVQMMTAFRSFYFVDALLRMLLEPVLSVIPLVNSKDEVFLREVLYDAAMMEYSLLGSQKGVHLPEGRLKNLAITWLFAADNALRFLREYGEQTKLISYIQAFSESCLPSQLIKWAMNQPSIQSKINTPEVSSPLSLINWLLFLEDQGVRVFDSDISKMYAKVIASKSKTEYGFCVIKSDGENLVENCFSSGDNKNRGEEKVDGDLDMVDSEETTLFVAPGVLKTTANNGTKKRKEVIKDEGDKQVKFVKCHLNDTLMRKKVSRKDDDDGLSCGSGVDNLSSDENVEYMEQ